MEFWPQQWRWWLVLSFEALAMEVVGLIYRWRDQVRREEKRGLRLNLFAIKKKKNLVTWRVRIGWRKTHLLHQLLTQFILFLLICEKRQAGFILHKEFVFPNTCSTDDQLTDNQKILLAFHFPIVAEKILVQVMVSTISITTFITTFSSKKK